MIDLTKIIIRPCKAQKVAKYQKKTAYEYSILKWLIANVSFLKNVQSYNVRNDFKSLFTKNNYGIIA